MSASVTASAGWLSMMICVAIMTMVTMGKVEGAAAGVPPPGPGDMYNGDDGAAGLGTGPGTGPGTKRVLIFGSGWGSSGTTSLNEALGTRLLGPLSTILTALSLMCVCVHRRRVPRSPICA